MYYCVPRYIATLSLVIKLVESALPCHICHTNKLQNIQRFRQNKTYLVEQQFPSNDHITPAPDINKKANALTKLVFAIICDFQMTF